MKSSSTEKIEILNPTRKKHSKASEEYISVRFNYDNDQWEGWVPVVYRRTGLDLKDEEVSQYLKSIYDDLNPSKHSLWVKEQQKFWAEEKKRAQKTKEFFDSLAKGGWQCVECTLPTNPNWARRIQDLKEFGYTIATDTNHHCSNCGSNKTHLIMLPIRRNGNNGNGYETWSPKLRKRIISILKGIDVYENKENKHCLPDHKFSEIRWDDNTKEINSDKMTDDEIKKKFQLLSNQRNQQKREVCRNCYQTGKRGIIYGIPYYYEGNEEWDSEIPRKGKKAEKGCIGCPWYDIETWRKNLMLKLNDKL